MDLTISAWQGMVNIDTRTGDQPESFSFGTIAGMYTTGAGVGCQVNDEALREDIMAMCLKISDAIQQFGLKHPELPILDKTAIRALQTPHVRCAV